VEGVDECNDNYANDVIGDNDDSYDTSDAKELVLLGNERKG